MPSSFRKNRVFTQEEIQTLQNRTPGSEDLWEEICSVLVGTDGEGILFRAVMKQVNTGADNCPNGEGILFRAAMKPTPHENFALEVTAHLYEKYHERFLARTLLFL